VCLCSSTVGGGDLLFVAFRVGAVRQKEQLRLKMRIETLVAFATQGDEVLVDCEPALGEGLDVVSLEFNIRVIGLPHTASFALIAIAIKNAFFLLRSEAALRDFPGFRIVLPESRATVGYERMWLQVHGEVLACDVLGYEGVAANPKEHPDPQATIDTYPALVPLLPYLRIFFRVDRCRYA